MTQSQSDSFIERIFCVLSHHLNLSILYIAQSIFYKGRFSRTISLQIHYFVLFKNNRDRGSVLALCRQVAPSQSQAILEIYNDCMNKPYSYLIIDTSPSSDQKYKFRTNIFPQESSSESSNHYPAIYRIK